MSQLDNKTPVTIVPIQYIREQLRIAEIDVAEATMKRDSLRLILELREIPHRNRTAEIIAKFYP